MFSRKLFLTISAIGMISSSALAQVAPPPPPPSDPKPEFVPPPPPAPMPAQPAQKEFKQTKAKQQESTSDLPSIPHPPLWEFCGTEDPRVDEVCRFKDNLHYVALRPNPTISPGMVPKIQQVIVARRSRFEKLVIENLDVAVDIDSGLIQSVSITDPTSLSELLETISPLTPPTNLTQELQNREVITKTQGRFNNKIIGDYQRAYGQYLRRAYPDEATDRFMRSMFEDSVIESTQAYEGLLHESRLSVDLVLAKVDGVPSGASEALRKLKIARLDSTPDQLHESAEAVKLAWRPLSMEQKKQYLSAVRSLRANENIPPVPTINVMWAGKKVVENKPGAKIIDSSKVKLEGVDIE